MPKIRERKHKKGHSLELFFDNKKFVKFLVKDIKMDYGNKTFRVKIPKRFLDWEYSKHVLRGLFEADGSLYFSKSKSIDKSTYPRIELRTSSKNLASQIFSILAKQEYRVRIMRTKYKDFKVYLSGTKMLEKWVREIGFSNNNTITKYLFWKKFGHYIPKITPSQRKILLKIDNQDISQRGSVPKRLREPN